MAYAGVIEKYRDLINIPDYSIPISLNEGNTPLIPLPRLAKELGADFDLFIKYEGLNPTGSFKDRGMTTAMSEAIGRKVNSVICASTGNTAASAAAYAAHAGINSYVLIPRGKVAAGKLAGAITYGAKVIQIKGSFDDALNLVTKICDILPIALVNSLNPYRLEGQKTAAFEICEDLGQAPDYLCIPVGNAGNITAYWMGFKQFDQVKHTSLPVILGVQASGAAPLVKGHTIDHPETIATAIRIGRPARGEQALTAASESGGKIIDVTDEQIIEMQMQLASHGIWVEPASAAGLAGLKNQIRKGIIELTGKSIVAVCTGHGLKDPDIIVNDIEAPIEIDTDIETLKNIIQG